MPFNSRMHLTMIHQAMTKTYYHQVASKNKKLYEDLVLHFMETVGN
jgi:hypothetical protein